MLLCELDRGIDLIALVRAKRRRPDRKSRPCDLGDSSNNHERRDRGLINNPPALPPGMLPAQPIWTVPLGSNPPNSPFTIKALPNSPFNDELIEIQRDFYSAIQDVPGLRRALEDYQKLSLTDLSVQFPKVKHRDSVKEELFVQKTLEDRWEKLK